MYLTPPLFMKVLDHILTLGYVHVEYSTITAVKGPDHKITAPSTIMNGEVPDSRR